MTRSPDSHIPFAAEQSAAEKRTTKPSRVRRKARQICGRQHK